MAKFAVGEIAILARAPDGQMNAFDLRCVGREVEILSEPYRNPCFDNRVHYDVDAPWLAPPPDTKYCWCAAEDCLIKRRPPPDWDALSSPVDVPTEELA